MNSFAMADARRFILRDSLRAKRIVEVLVPGKDTKEISSGDGEFPHTRNEIRSIAVVKKLSLEKCRILFQQIRSLNSAEAADMTERYLEIKRE